MAISSDERRLFVTLGERIAQTRAGAVPQWQRQIEAVAQLPKSQQQFISRMIEMVLAQAIAR